MIQIKGKMTLDKLGTMVASGFSDVDKRFDAIEARLDRMETRLEKIEGRVDRLESRVNRIELKLDEIHEVVVQGEQDILKLQRKVKGFVRPKMATR